MRNNSKKKQVSLKDAIRKSVEILQKRFPLINKKLIEMYISSLIPLTIPSSKFNAYEIQEKLNDDINKNIDSFDKRIEKYAYYLESSLSSCPCNRRISQ